MGTAEIVQNIMALESILGGNFSSKSERFGGGRHSLNSVNFLQDDPLADPKFTVPAVAEPAEYLKQLTESENGPQIKFLHGTTTLGFKFQHGVIIAVDSRATAGNYIASQTVKK